MSVLDTEIAAFLECEFWKTRVHDLEEQLHRREAQSKVNEHRRQLEIRALHLECEAWQIRAELAQDYEAQTVAMKQYLAGTQYWCPCERFGERCSFYE